MVARVGKRNIKNWQEKLFSRGKENVGSRYNLECPYCKANNTYILDGTNIYSRLVKATSNRHPMMLLFERDCWHCQKPIFCEAELDVKIKAKAVE